MLPPTDNGRLVYVNELSSWQLQVMLGFGPNLNLSVGDSIIISGATSNTDRPPINGAVVITAVLAQVDGLDRYSVDIPALDGFPTNLNYGYFHMVGLPLPTGDGLNTDSNGNPFVDFVWGNMAPMPSYNEGDRPGGSPIPFPEANEDQNHGWSGSYLYPSGDLQTDYAVGLNGLAYEVGTMHDIPLLLWSHYPTFTPNTGYWD